jgi:3-phenylpropionate/cinnamic acid dioxygenase small subunit
MANDSLIADQGAHGVVDLDTMARLERFVYREAALMDAHEYDGWLSLWQKENILYWVPCNDDDQDPKTSIAIIYDKRQALEDRVQRMKDKTAHAFRPRAKLLRTVSNIVALSKTDSELVVSSHFTLGELRVGMQNIWFGRSIHTLTDTAGGLRIQSKKVLLLNNDAPMPNLTFLV